MSIEEEVARVLEAETSLTPGSCRRVATLAMGAIGIADGEPARLKELLAELAGACKGLSVAHGGAELAGIIAKVEAEIGDRKSVV